MEILSYKFNRKLFRHLPIVTKVVLSSWVIFWVVLPIFGWIANRLIDSGPDFSEFVSAFYAFAVSFVSGFLIIKQEGVRDYLGGMIKSINYVAINLAVLVFTASLFIALIIGGLYLFVLLVNPDLLRVMDLFGPRGAAINPSRSGNLVLDWTIIMSCFTVIGSAVGGVTGVFYNRYYSKNAKKQKKVI